MPATKQQKEESPIVSNIKEAVRKGNFNVKVQPGEPEFTQEEELKVLAAYLEEKKTLSYKFKNGFVSTGQNLLAYLRNSRSNFYGMENLYGQDLHGGIVTSNHFCPLENTIILRVIKKYTHRKSGLHAVSQMSNFAMPGGIGFVLRYANVIPVSRVNPEYMCTAFMDEVMGICKRGDYVLIYPEQEMWLNYRKPRPLKPGAYYFAAKLGLPVISCFVAIRDKNVMLGVWKTSFDVYVLPVIYPDPKLGTREAARKMMETDYAQKKAAYERAYGKPLDYTFEPSDIAGL